MYSRTATYLISVVLAGILVVCSLPVNPNNNPDNAKIAKENLSSLQDTLEVGTHVTCSLIVQFRHLIDSVSVVVEKNGLRSALVSGELSGDTIVFSLDLITPADYTVTVKIFKDKIVDSSLVKVLHVYPTTPVVRFVHSRMDIIYGDSVGNAFTITDPDSNLIAYNIYHNGVLTDSVNVLASERFTINDTINSFANQSLKNFNEYRIIARDEDDQVNQTSVCTLSVSDTVLPEVTLLQPEGDSTFTIMTLPCTLTFKINDNWMLDSVKIGGFQQQLPTNDTLKWIKTSAELGTIKDSIELWDRGGNRSVLIYSITYNGLKTYPPELKQVTIKPVFEHSVFDTLYLDSLVRITDSTAIYTKDSLQWNISAEETDPFLIPHYDAIKRTFYVEVPDTEITKSRLATYNISVTDPKGLSSETLHLSYYLLEVNDAPKITVKDQKRVFGTPFDTLTLADCGFDTDPQDRVNWTITRGKYFKPDSIWFMRVLAKSSPIIKPVSFFTGKVAIIPDTTQTSKVPFTSGVVDSLLFTATDGEKTTKKYVKFTWNRLVPMF